VIDRGRVIAEGTPADLKASIGTGSLTVRLLDPARRAEAAELLERTVGPVVLEPEPTALSATGADAGRAAVAVAELSRAGFPLAHFSLQQPSLDEVFLALTGHAAEETSPPSDDLQEHLS
jgi:ABC-2 type transport system ATP-binding protein